MRYSRGLALLIVVGVLGILAVLAAAFVTMAQLERRASLQRLYATKAQLLARSGIEDALARLGAGQDADLPGTRYLGEDWNADGLLNGPEPAEEVLVPGTLDVETCPARHALRPSFFARDSVSANQPQLLRVDGRRRGYTGKLAGDRVAEGNHYAAKVMPQAGIYLNGGDLSSAGAHPGTYDTTLKRILGTLAEALDRQNGGADDGVPSDEWIGLALVDLRPQGGWKDMAQLRQIAKAAGPVNEAKILALLPYVTTSAWVDTRTLKPDATTAMQGVDPRTWSEVRQGVDASYAPTRGMPALEPRAPVNLAWARSRWPVLVALMGGLKGLYLDETSSQNADGSDFIGRMSEVELVLDSSLSTDPCREVASRLVGYAGPLEMDTWDDWDAFCDTLTSGDLDSNVYPTVPAMRSLLKANFNPNSRLNKFNPNRSLWNLVDKQDLLVYSTEFVLEPVHAHEVQSVGRVLGKDGRLLALRTLRCEIPGPKVARLSTQREFVCSDLGSLERSGDEAGVRIPGRAADAPFLPMSQGPGGTFTWGQDLPGLGGKGVGVQSYPEPYVDLDTSSTGWDLDLSPADYDGSLQQATLETMADDTYTVPAGSGMKMLARWTADLDLAVSDADPSRSSMAPGAKWRNQPDMRQAPLANSLLDSGQPNTLHPDGCYSERDKAPGYFDKDNANGLQGLMSFWFKPNYHMVAYLDQDAALIPGTAALRRRHQFVKWSNYVDSTTAGIAGSKDQFFGLTDGGQIGSFATAPLPNFACCFDSGHKGSDAKNEHRFQTPQPSTGPPHRWRLLTFAWDFLASDKDDTGELVLDSGTATSDTASWDDYDPVGNDPTSASDLTNDDMFGDYPKNGFWFTTARFPHIISLGRRGYLAEYGGAKIGLGADATFDEFAIYDFGPGVGALGGPPATLALKRFQEGRYYKESGYPASRGLLVPPGSPARTAAEYFSAPIDLGGGRLISLSWTQVVPRGLRAPLPPPPAKAGIDGDDGPDDGEILLELSDLAPLPGTGYAPDASGGSIDTTFRNSVLSRVDRTPLGPFRLHAVFRPNLANQANTPILDPLALDDVTLRYESPGGRAILSWGEGAP